MMKGFSLILICFLLTVLVPPAGSASDNPMKDAPESHGSKITGTAPESMDHSSGAMDHSSGAMDHSSGAMDHSSGAMDHSSGAMDHSSGAMDSDSMDHGNMDTDTMGSGGMEPAQKEMANEHDHSGMIMAAQKEEPALADQVKLEEQLGKYIDFGASFVDENNKPVDLKTIFDKPVLLLPVYFMCTSVCNFLQAELANVLNLVGQTPGKDFNIISVSFADDEDASHARTSKRNYANLLKREIPREAILKNWYYLTSDRVNIRKLTDSIGYYFIKKKPHFYIHPSAMVVLAKDGKIIRYLYGPGFLPFDVGMALSEAKSGEPGISIKRGVLSFCFDYDPENKTYVFKMFRITGTAILVLLVGFVLFLIYPSKKSRKKRKFGQ